MFDEFLIARNMPKRKSLDFKMFTEHSAQVLLAGRVSPAQNLRGRNLASLIQIRFPPPIRCKPSAQSSSE
ncbi:MAG: hypothetical protein KIS67_10165 [Verrucomicrobiae bacterium]|nr:hypothetical protein [Verrucomicrobiae bacterium]